jgi:integrase
VSKILNWAVKNGYGIRRIPGATGKLKESRYRVQLFTIDEFRAVLAVAPITSPSPETRLLHRREAGPSELFAVKYTDCDWRQNRIHIHAAKTDTWRWQYIDATFMQELRDRMQTLQSAGFEPVYTSVTASKL